MSPYKEGNLGKLEIHKVDRIIASALIGGTASKLSGGKFANGALSGALAQMYNGEVSNKSAITLPHSLFFDGKKLKWLDGNGDVIAEWNASSGKSGTTAKDQYKINYGPIPEGEYTIDPSLTDEFNWYDIKDWDWYGPAARASWGNFRTPISINEGTNIGERTGGFFIHGGTTAGSAGCIDLTIHNEKFHQTLQNHNQKLQLKVTY